MRYSVLLASMIALLSACAPVSHDPRGLQDEGYETTYRGLPYSIADLTVSDSREGVEPRTIKVPGMSFPWSSDEVRPELADAHRDSISAEVYRHFVGGDSVTIQVDITEGVQRFNAGFMTESGHVEFGVTISVRSLEDSEEYETESGEAEIRTQSFDTSADKIAVLYDKVIAASIEDCLGKFHGQLSGTGDSAGGE